MKSEYDEAGLRFDRGAVRVDRLAEAVVIVKRLFDRRAGHLRTAGTIG